MDDKFAKEVDRSKLIQHGTLLRSRDGLAYQVTHRGADSVTVRRVTPKVTGRERKLQNRLQAEGHERDRARVQITDPIDWNEQDRQVEASKAEAR